MSDRIKKIKIKQSDGTFSDYIPIGANAKDVDMANGYSLENTIGTIDVDKEGSIAKQLSKTTKYYDSVADMKADTQLTGGAAAVTLGYYKPNDGGGALYQIIDSTDEDYESLVDDGGSAHDLKNNLKAKLIVKDSINVKQFGAYGDGVSDDIEYISLAIQKFPTRTIYFPKGHYKISAPINVPQGNTDYVNIKMDSSTILSATQQISTGILYGRDQTTSKYSRTKANPVGYIEGGIIDCSLMTNGIKLNSNRQLTQIKYVTFRNISSVGLALERGSNYGSGDFKIHFCNFFRKDSYDGTAIYSACDDNEFQHIRVDGCRIGFNLIASNNFLHDIHCTALYTTTENQLEKMNETEAFRSCSGGDKYNQCYADTYATGWRFPAGTGTFKLNECTNYYYDAFLDEATTQAIKIEGSLKMHVDISNCTFNSCRKGDHCFIRTEASPYKEALFDHQLRLRNNTYVDNYNTTKSLDLAYCIPLHNENYLAPFWTNQTIEANKYYKLGEFIIGDNIPLELTFNYKNTVHADIIININEIKLQNSSFNTSANQWKFSIAKSQIYTVGDRDYQGYYFLFSTNNTITQDSKILLSNISPSLFFGKKLYTLFEIVEPDIISSADLNKID